MEVLYYRQAAANEPPTLASRLATSQFQITWFIIVYPYAVQVRTILVVCYQKKRDLVESPRCLLSKIEVVMV
jgi:hypothetical protein